MNDTIASVEPKAAKDVHVHCYRQILLWPLLLKKKSSEPDLAALLAADDPISGGATGWRRGQLDEWISRFAHSPWTKVPTLPAEVAPSAKSDPVSCEPTHEEIVYFHPFVRDFLYGDGSGNESERSLFRFRRTDIAELELQLTSDGTSESDPPAVHRFDVLRTELYLCKPLVAILVVEVVWKSRVGAGDAPLTLADVLVLQSRIRQVYPPYFNWDDERLPGNAPYRVQWLGRRAPDSLPAFVIESDCSEGRSHFAKFTHLGAEPPVALHWQRLLEPLRPFPGRVGRDDYFYQQIVDDRMPAMTYLAVDDPRAIRPGDFDRLTFCETGGETLFPYTQQFLDDRRVKHVYERFWRPTGDHDSSDLKFSTRYLCSGTHFVAVGSVHDWFFRMLIPDHFRRHYFRIGLIVQYHRAALLKFADDMAEAIKLLRDQSPGQELGNPLFRTYITWLQQTFLKFRCRSWFTEVSNQPQGQELFAWWTELLGNSRLFREVDDTAEAVYSALAEYDARQVVKKQTFLTGVAIFIAVVGIIISVIALIVGLH